MNCFRPMEAEAANARRVDWGRLVLTSSLPPAPRSPSATTTAIAVALNLLDDFESHYRGSDGCLVGPSPELVCQPGLTETPSLPDTIGYVRLNGCPCEGPAADQYAEAVQQAIRAADRPGLVGWIVDLREDRGGNMWPMIAGLGPIFGEGIIGWIAYNNRDYEREYRAGAALSLNEPFARVAVPYTLIQPLPKAAVLTADTTNSAGEAAPCSSRVGLTHGLSAPNLRTSPSPVGFQDEQRCDSDAEDCPQRQSSETHLRWPRDAG